MTNIFFAKKLAPIYLLLFCIAIISLTSCSGKAGKIRGILQISALEGIEIPFAAWEAFDYTGTDTCIVNQSNGLTPISLRKGARVEVVDEATCSQTIFNKTTGESTIFITGLSKARFPSPTNIGNASAGAHAEGIGSFWELWIFTSNIKIVEEKLRTQARTNPQNADKIKKQKEAIDKLKEKEKAK